MQIPLDTGDSTSYRWVIGGFALVLVLGTVVWFVVSERTGNPDLAAPAIPQPLTQGDSPSPGDTPGEETATSSHRQSLAAARARGAGEAHPSFSEPLDNATAESGAWVKADRIDTSGGSAGAVGVQGLTDGVGDHRPTPYEIQMELARLLLKQFDTLKPAGLDDRITVLLRDESMTRNEKLEILWGLINQFHREDERYRYLLSKLPEMTPVELTGQLIQEYQQVNDGLVKEQLLAIIRSAISNNGSPVAEQDMAVIQARQQYLDLVRARYEGRPGESNIQPRLFDTLPVLSREEALATIDGLASNTHNPDGLNEVFDAVIMYVADEPGQTPFVQSLLDRLRNYPPQARIALQDALSRYTEGDEDYFSHETHRLLDDFFHPPR